MSIGRLGPLAGRYDLTDLIGSGAMGRVYRARDRVLQRDVAVKVGTEVSDDVRDQFVNEARVLARLSHESIVSPYDAGLDDAPPWLVLELVEGQPLSQVLARGPIDHAVLADLAGQVAAGLAHAHASGVVHQDVKPSNVMITAAGRARLTDFGVARLVVDDARVEDDQRVVGTAAYIAPEQLRGESVTGAADIYALGLLMLEALTGRRCFTGESPRAAMARLHHGPLIPTSLPRGWSALLAAATALQPGSRPSAAELSSRLDRLARPRPSDSEPDGTASFPVATSAATPA